MWYVVLKYVVLGPVVRFFARPRISGAEHIPAHGPVIIAANHLAEIDSLVLALTIPRRLTFIAKLEYFSGEGARGRLHRWFYSSVGQIPVDRSGGRAADRALEAARGVLDSGEAWAVYPEGTRSPDGRLFKGHTGLARVALSVPEATIVPVGIIGTREIDPPDARGWRRGRVQIHVGVGIDPGEWLERRHTGSEDGTIRELTDVVMERIGALTGQESAERYPTKAEQRARDQGRNR